MFRGRSLARRLVARAFVLGLDPALSVSAQGAHLAQLAVRAPASLELAILAIEAGPDRDSERGVQAIAALRAAIRVTPAQHHHLHVGRLGRVG